MRFEFSVRTLRHASELLNGNDCAFTALFYAKRDGDTEYDLDVAYSWERAELAYDESRC